MIYATGIVTMMMAGAAMAPGQTAAVGVPQKKGRDLLFTGESYFSIKDNDKKSGGTKDDYGYVGSVYEHFSKFDGYHEDDNYNKDDQFIKQYGGTFSKAKCSSYASAHAYSEAKYAHISYTKKAILGFCKPNWDGKLKDKYKEAEDYAAAIAKAITASQADCVSEGNAFGCASATALAAAWAEAEAGAHVKAVAEAYDECEERYGCPIDTHSLAVASAETFIELTADVFSRSEVYACSKYHSAAWAGAYSKCAAVAYAKIWTEAYAKAYLKTGCAKSEAATVAYAEAGSDYYTIEGCDREDDHDSYGHGTSGSTTYGSDAYADVYEIFPNKY